MQCNKNI